MILLAHLPYRAFSRKMDGYQMESLGLKTWRYSRKSPYEFVYLHRGE